VIGTVATYIAKGGLSREHEQKSQQMGDELVLRFLGVLETTQYTLEQSHGAPPFSVALHNTTLEDEGYATIPQAKLSEVLYEMLRDILETIQDINPLLRSIVRDQGHWDLDRLEERISEVLQEEE
jgi:hypothetical protein